MSARPGFEIVAPDSDKIGCEIRGLNLALPQPQSVIEALRDLLFARHVLVFRGQRLRPCDQVSFARRFGKAGAPEASTALSTHFPDQPEIQWSSFRRADGSVPADRRPSQADSWHTDYSYLNDPPELACLYGVEIPVDGPETWFTDMESAFAALPTEERERLRNMRARHVQRGALDPTLYRLPPYLEPGQADDGSADRSAIHPLVRPNPRTGAATLYLAECYMTAIEGQDTSETRATLRALYAHVAQPAFVYRHAWSEGDLLFWSNVSTNHRRSKPIDCDRVLHRVTIKLDRP